MRTGTKRIVLIVVSVIIYIGGLLFVEKNVGAVSELIYEPGFALPAVTDFTIKMVNGHYFLVFVIIIIVVSIVEVLFIRDFSVILYLQSIQFLIFSFVVWFIFSSLMLLLVSKMSRF